MVARGHALRRPISPLLTPAGAVLDSAGVEP